MSISHQLKQIAAADIFSLAEEKAAFVGHPFYFDYDLVQVLVADARKKGVGGIPQGTFLLAFYDNEQDQPEAVLLRALRPTKLPTDQDVIQSMIEYYKDNLRVSGASSQLDEYTRYEFSFSGLECRVLGTFYEDSRGALVFGADLENFYSAHNYSVYKPHGAILERIVNFRDGDTIPGQVSDVRIGEIRYSSSRRFQEQETEHVPFYVSPADFLGKRTALFGMTRTGKSNTVKKVIQATVEISATAPLALAQNGANADLFNRNPSDPYTENSRPKFPVGQMIFDINGEYANANLQDEGTAIFELFRDQVTRFSILEKPGFKVMKTNFYEDVEEGFELVKSLLQDDSTRFVANFRALELTLPDDKKDDRSFSTRHERHVAAYKCCLYAAGFKAKVNSIRFPGTAELNSLSGVDPGKGVTYDQAINWFTVVWDAIGDNEPFFDKYKKSHDGRDWADEDLKALLVMLTRKRASGSDKQADCSGFRVLKPALDLHTPSVDKPYAEAIVEQLRAGRIVIADLSQGDPTIIRLYSEKICGRVFADAMENFIQNRSNNFIQMYFEEAHNLFPKKEDKDLSQVYNRLAKEGAKLNIGIIYATQEVSSISSNILKNTQNWFIAHLNNADELKEIEKFYDYDDFSVSLSRFSASTDKGFIRVKTYSNPYTVPVQVDRFSASPTLARMG